MFYKIVSGLLRGFLFLLFGAKLRGKENMPSDGGIIVAVNHRSNWDPVIAGAFSPRRLTFMAKSELFSFKPFGWLISKLGAFPVKRGRGDIGAIKGALSILKAGRAMLIFPEGTRNHDTVEHAKTGVSMIALHAQVPVVPVYISGHCRPFGKLCVTIGKPVDFSEYYGTKQNSEGLQRLADEVLSCIRALKVGE